MLNKVEALLRDGKVSARLNPYVLKLLGTIEDARGTGAGCVRAVPLTEWARLVASYAEHLQRPTWPGLLADAGLLP